jgi:hypothetical protein
VTVIRYTTTASRSACYFVITSTIKLTTTIVFDKPEEDSISKIIFKLAFHFASSGASVTRFRCIPGPILCSGIALEPVATGVSCALALLPSNGQHYQNPWGGTGSYRGFRAVGRLTARSHQNRTTQHSCVQPAFDIDIARHRGNPHVKAASCNRGRATRELNQYRQLQTKPIPERPLINQADLFDVCALPYTTRHGGRIISQTGATPSRTQP